MLQRHKKKTVFLIFFTLLFFMIFITLLRSQILSGIWLYKSNPAERRAHNTQSRIAVLLQTGRRFSSAADRAETNPAARRAGMVFLRNGRRFTLTADRFELIGREAEHDKGEGLKDGGGQASHGSDRPQDYLIDHAIDDTVDDTVDDWLDDLVERIWQVESGGRVNSPDGDGGKAVGPLQMHKCVIDDVNRRYRTDFGYADRRDLAKSKRIAKLYVTMWLDVHKEEIAARIFNGGPRGWQKKSTDVYWQKVQKLR